VRSGSTGVGNYVNRGATGVAWVDRVDEYWYTSMCNLVYGLRFKE